MTSTSLEQSYALAKERYAQWGVDTESALKSLAGTPISIHCWQGDDVGGFENVRRVDRGRDHGHGQLHGPGPHRRTSSAPTPPRPSA